MSRPVGTAPPPRRAGDGRIVCVGDVMVDVVGRLPGELVVGSDRPAPVRMYGGGSAANTASWIAASGGPVTLVGRVGDDVLGRESRRELSAVGVDVALAVDARRSTGICIVLVAPDGERTMVPDAGASAALAVADFADDLFDASRHLHLSAYTLLGPARPAGQYVLDAAREAGMTVSVDAASTGPIAAVGAETFLSWLGADVLLLANAAEARQLTGSSDPHSGARLLAGRVGRAVVKLGAGGAVWSDGHAVIEAATTRIEVVDSTGAGDAFAAGFLTGLRRGGSPADALRDGNRLAATACLLVGGRPAATNSQAD